MFNLSSFWGGSRAPAERPSDSLDAFASEQAATPASPSLTHRAAALDDVVRNALRSLERNPAQPAVYLAAGLLIVLAIGGFALDRWVSARPVPAVAVVTIESDPGGATVLMQGMPKGITPLALSLPPGDHAFVLVHEGRQKSLRLSARPDSSVVHHVQFDRTEVPGRSPPPAVPAVAAPPPAQPRVAATAPGAVGGWLSLSTPIPVQILENGQVVGTSAAQRLMLPAGSRQLRFINEALGFSADRTVQLKPGQTASLSLTVPRAPLNINAVPWAEVWLDGVRIGETPIGNHMVAIGNHDVVLRHPQFGERRHSATVSLKTPARVSVDMRKPQ